ncbi:MAG: hypothetical protein ACLUTA_15945 [Blautia wexlerae]
MINNLQNCAAKKQIELKYSGGSATGAGSAPCAYMKCSIILRDNAIRYTPEGGEVKVFVGKLNGKPYFRVGR